MRIFNFLKNNSEHRKSIRVNTNIGDKYINVKLGQTYESMDILSLKIFQKDLYRLFDADYGIIVGRVLANGVGIPNAKVSVFIPLDEEDIINPTTLDDIKKIEAAALYPFQTVFDTDGNGKVYNLLPKYSKNRNFNGFPDNDYGIGTTPKTPVGTFPEKDEILVNETVAYVYEKYLKFTTVTNESGDYILTVPANKSYTVNMSCDITDIGRFSTCAALLKLEGYPDNYFTENGTQINEDIPLERLPNIDIQNNTITVKPLWSQNSNNTNVGINRLDFQLTKKIRPFSTVIGNYFTPNNRTWWGDRIVFRLFLGIRALCVTLLGGCTPADSSKFITAWIGIRIKICVDLPVIGEITIPIVNVSYNIQNFGSDCGFRFCLGFKVKGVLPFINFFFNENNFCTLNGGKTKLEAFDLRYIYAPEECLRKNALQYLGGEITDGLFIQIHERGDIDIKVFNIDKKIDEIAADNINNLQPSFNSGDERLYPDYDTNIKLLDESEYVKYINNGNFIILLPSNRYKVITNENGDLIPVDNDSERGVFIKNRSYFYLTHNEDPVNPPTQNRTGRIRLKIPQFNDYNLNPLNWIWKHYSFDAGDIYSISQYNNVRKNTFSSNDESTDDDVTDRLRSKEDRKKGFDEQTNIFFTGYIEEPNEATTFLRNNNTGFTEHKDFYNHLTVLGKDGVVNQNYGDLEPIEEEDQIEPGSADVRIPVGIYIGNYGPAINGDGILYRGWNMYPNGRANGGPPGSSASNLIDIKIRVVIELASQPVENEWNINIRAFNAAQVNGFIANGYEFYLDNEQPPPSNNKAAGIFLSSNLKNLTPTEESETTYPNGSPQYFKAFDVVITVDKFFNWYSIPDQRNGSDGIFRNAENWILRVENSTNTSIYRDLTITTIYTSETNLEFDWGGNGGIVNFLSYDKYNV
jgi:hypothetical protein